VTKLRMEYRRFGFQFAADLQIFLLSTATRRTLGVHYLTQWVPGTLGFGGWPLTSI
jgi:hypothetical protein